MRNIFRNSYYITKSVYGDKMTLFWVVIFPLLLATLFNLAMGNLIQGEGVEPIPIGISSDASYGFIYEQINILDTSTLSEEEAEKDLLKGDIKAYVDKDNVLVFNGTGISENIVKEIGDTIVQISNSDLDSAYLDTQVNFLEFNNPEITLFANYFYALVAMNSLYGTFFGIGTMSMIQPWESSVALRVSISPKSKRLLILESSVVGIIISIGTTLLLMAYIQYFLKLKIFVADAYNLIFPILGSITGVAFGIVIGVYVKSKIEPKIFISIALVMILTFLDGMMSYEVKTLVEENAPVLARLNPVTIISNNLTNINVFRDYGDIISGSLILIGIIGVLVLISSLKMRGEKFDSI